MRSIILRAAALTTALATLGACIPGYYEGGSRASIDQHVYVSYPHVPKTVSLVDTRTGETIWTVDVPVGQQLVVRFKNDVYEDDPNRPSVMKWELMDAGERHQKLTNSLRVPHWTSRRLDWTTRPAPELEPDMAAGEDA